MDTKIRLDANNATYYIRVNSAHQKRLFDSILEFNSACDLLENIAQPASTEVYGFCFLQQEVHFLIKSDTPAIEAIKQWCMQYSHWYHSIHPHKHALFESKLLCLLIEPKLYLNPLIRYTHLLPKEQGLVPNSDIYPWSSHQRYIHEHQFPWVNSSTLLREICLKRSRRINRYESFINEQFRSEKRLDLHVGNHPKYLALARPEYIRQIIQSQNNDLTQVTYSLDDIINTVCEEYRVDPSMLVSARKIRRVAEVKAVICWLNHEICKRPLSELADMLAIDIDTIHIYLRSMQAKHPVFIQRFKERLEQNLMGKLDAPQRAINED
ncbi:MAG: hypothetical protein COB04_13080 [Gammaproteobacteria bacterium]|nr:MAG: hypothetical protein COB04_13080 [Gammaproteobacteria bacterium]